MWQVFATIIGILIGPLIAKVLAYLGLAFVTYLGFDSLFPDLSGMINDRLGQLPTDIYNILALSGIFTAVNILVSAYISKAVVDAAGGALRKVIFTKV